MKETSNYLLRALLIKKFKGCQACNSDKKLVVHHVNYERIGCEYLTDIRLLCEFCHNFLHTFIKGKDSDIRTFTDLFIKGIPNWKLEKDIKAFYGKNK